MNGQAETMVPIAAAAPVATKRKSRRVAWSAEEVVVVTIPNPFLSSAPMEPPRKRPQSTAKKATTPKTGSEVACRRPRPPRRQRDQLFRPEGPNKQSRIVLLAPLPGERKPVIGRQGRNGRNRPRPLFYSYNRKAHDRKPGKRCFEQHALARERQDHARTIG